jgi:predicted transcriptional regulator of viral defense system
LNRSRFSIAKPYIEALFNQDHKKVFTQRNLANILSENAAEWRLKKSITTPEFIDYLLEKSKLKKISLSFPKMPRPINLYIWGEEDEYSVFDISMYLMNNAYLSHYTAMFINNLTEQIPKNVYVTYEQSRKTDYPALTQDSIDTAFRKPVRLSNNIAKYKDFNITLLSGVETNNHGVIKTDLEGKQVRVTNLERTLIDIVVRPAYSGGVYEILKAYEFAKDKVSINKLNAYLKYIRFIYPYHQAIGFYLERAGYEKDRINILQSDEIKYNFYLINQIKEPAYSKKWKIYYPKYLDL